MKTKQIIILLLIFLFLNIQFINCQTKNNFDFERLDSSKARPDGLSLIGSKDYTVAADSVIKQNGKYSLYIASNEKIKGRGFASYGFWLPSDYEGTQIRLKGFIKTENVSDSGYAGLVLRLDGEKNKVLFFDNMSKKGIKGTNDWQAFTIYLPFNEQVKNIYAGVILCGKGKAWFDNLQITINDQDISTIPKRKIYPAELDTSLNLSSNIKIEKWDRETIENLSILCKIWGFLKYFHPAIAKGKYNWDYELFRIMPKIISCKDKNERDEILYNWIESLGKVEKCFTCNKTNMENAKMQPDLEWIKDKKVFNDKLIQQLKYILENRSQGEQYYISVWPNARNPNFKNENSYKKMKYDDQGYMLLSLFRYWNIIQYFFPYKYAIGEDWNMVLPEFIEKFLNSMDELQYKLTTLELKARIHDTHAQVYNFEQVLLNYKGQYFPTFNLSFIEGKAVVMDFFNENYAKESPLKKGDIISKIDGIGVDEIVKNRIPFTPASNEVVQLREISKDLLAGKNKYVKIEYIRNGDVFNVEIERYNYALLAQYLIPKKKDTCYKFIKENIGYIYMGAIKNQYIPKIMESFRKSKGIIIDMRCYPSEFVVYSLSEFLMPGYTDFVKYTTAVLDFPGLFRWSPSTTVGYKNNNYYKGKIVILVNEETQSRAEFTTMAFRVAPKAKVIGSTTAGADGDLSLIDLPGGIRTGISGIGIYYPNGKETQRVGIIPDIEVKPTIKGIKEGRDEVLEKAIEIIEKKSK